MDKEYLGDSYDLIKRFFCQVLGPIAPLYAHPQFVPSAIREAYVAVTTIPIFDTRPRGPFGILLDPDIGIPLPNGFSVGTTRKHASIPFVVELSRTLNPAYMICFDQSYHRKHELSRKDQRDTKRKFLLDQGLRSFYYVSHAPFLFIAQSPETLNLILNRLVSAGIPKGRFEASRIVA